MVPQRVLARSYLDAARAMVMEDDDTVWVCGYGAAQMYALALPGRRPGDGVSEDFSPTRVEVEQLEALLESGRTAYVVTPNRRNFGPLIRLASGDSERRRSELERGGARLELRGQFGIVGIYQATTKATTGRFR